MPIINKDTIRSNTPFILKWSENPGTEGAWNPGWKQQTEGNTFLDIIENRPSIMNDAVFHTMDSKEEDISYMRVRSRLQSMKKLSGTNKGAQRTTDYLEIDETVPEFSRSKLVAEPFSSFTLTPKTFLLENVEKQGFLAHMESRLAEEAGYSAELIGMYGVKNDNAPSTDGIYSINGIFQQLTDLKTAYDAAVSGGTAKPFDPQGYYTDIDLSKPLVPQVKKMITQFTKQKGKKANAIIYVSSLFEGALTEEADQRPTEKGDNLYFEDGQLKLWGVPIKQADFLDDPQLEWGEQILIANPDGIVFGFLDAITSENEYKLEYKAYLSTVDVYFDTLLLYNKDALAAKVTGDYEALAADDDESPAAIPETRKVSFNVVDEEDEGISNAEIVIDNTITKVTGSSGGCSETLSDGVHSITVSATGYTSSTQEITVSEDNSSFKIVLESE